MVCDQGSDAFHRETEEDVYCPIKDNRYVDDSGGAQAYSRVDILKWSEEEKQHGNVVKINGFPITTFDLSGFAKNHLTKSKKYGIL